MVHNGLYAIADPWVALAGMATATTTLKLGTLITPVARRRPWKLARELVTLDQLSNGRVIFGVGLGEPGEDDFGRFGEDPDARTRAARLDEGLALIDAFQRGEPVQFDGAHYTVDSPAFKPGPVQQPRIPVWVGGNFPNRLPMRRAARWDGYVPIAWKPGYMSLEDWDEAMAVIAAERDSDTPLTRVQASRVPGNDPAEDAAIVAPYADYGIEWWVEMVDPFLDYESWSKPWPSGAVGDMQARIRRGPPRP
jgi:alkanesulfonate monooxygenase SsuD/methylene tetrahydromethanopterin reductase-like flavin-dependent oxidoreductase (luciferase family)